MSTGRGRSWRPEKTRRARDSRRLQIITVCVFLAALVGGVIFLLIGPTVPVLHFVFVAENSFESDSTGITPLPSGTAALNIARLKSVAQRFHDANPTRVGAPSDVSVLSELVDGLPFPPNETLVIYCSAEAWCIPDQNNSGRILIEFLPGRPLQKPVSFSSVLGRLAERSPARTLLLLDLAGRRPGMATGSVSDDIPQQIRNEVEAAKIDGLSVICASDRGERSWEYFTDAASASNDSAPASNSPAPSTPNPLPEFQGTAFGHFLAQAFTDGHCGTPEELFRFIKSETEAWSRDRFGETQSVWMVSTDRDAAQSELLKRAVLPKAAAAAKSGEAQAKEAPAPSASQNATASSDSKSDTDAGSSLTGAAPAIDNEPSTLLAKLSMRFEELRRGATAQLLMPADWIRLQTELLSAEQLVMNGDRREFERLHDNSLKKILDNIARKASELGATEDLEPVRDWLSAEVQLTPEESQLFGSVRTDFKEEPGKSAALRLPPELRDSGRPRRAFVSGLMKVLREQSQSIEAAPAAQQVRQIQEWQYLLKNLAANGWDAEEFPQQLSTIREVLQGEDTDWMAAAMKPLVRLLDLTQQTVQLSVGIGPDGAPLRREEWSPTGQESDRILSTLHAAERWLCVGPAGVKQAENRLDSAEQSLRILQQQAAQRQRLTFIRDAQRFEMPYLVQYLALRQEEVALPVEELEAVRRMADSALSGGVDASEFPGGQLDAIGFTRAHIDAMFALTRDFTAHAVEDSDELHWKLLQSYVNGRTKSSISTSERRQLLAIPTLSDRAGLLSGLNRMPTGRSDRTLHESSHSGIWISFWSLRLVAAISPQTDSSPQWEQWRSLVNAVAEGKSAELPTLRAVLAQSLRTRWSSAMEQLMRTDASEIFPRDSEITSLIAKNAGRRLAATNPDNRMLYFGLLRKLSPTAGPVVSAGLEVKNRDLELTSGSVNASVRVSHAAGIYVLNDGVTLANPETKLDGNWWYLNTEPGNENDVVLVLQVSQSSNEPKPVTIVAVNEHGAATASATMMLHPPSESSWAIEVVAETKGMPESKKLTLEFVDAVTRRLRLLPSTLDAVTKMHAPTALKFRLKQERGAARKVRVQLFHAADGRAFWPNPAILEFPEGVDSVELPLHPPVSVVAAAVPPAAVPAVPAIPTVVDLSTGLTVEITPEDLLRRVTSRITILPELAEPEQFVQRPEPHFNSGTSILEIRVERATIDDAAGLQPASLPVEVVFSHKLSQYLVQGVAPVPNLPAIGHTFAIRFRPEVEQILGDDELEFGLSVAGIPHAWWWRLSDGIQTPIEGDVPHVRPFLNLASDSEIKAVPDVQELMLGEGWRTAPLKARLQSTVFLHGGKFDSDDWQLSLYFQRQGTDGRDPATAVPFMVRKRFVEKVLVAPGENGAWLFSSTTEPYSPPAIDPTQAGLENGRYDLIASLQKNGSGADPFERSVAFVLDDSGPVLRKFETLKPRTKVTEVLRGTIIASDPESGVKTIRIGLTPDMMEPLTMTPGETVTAKFELDASKVAFLKLLEQKESDNEQSVNLYIEAQNFAGKSTAIPQLITFYLPGKAPKMEEAPPGGIEVTFNSATPYVVSVKGPKGKLEPKIGARSVVFSGLPVGEYDVEWKTDGTGQNANSQKKVRVLSDKTTTVVGKK